MYARPIVLLSAAALCAAFCCTALVPAAHAQITEPDVTGHGFCAPAPGVEPASMISVFGLDSFLRDSAARLVAAAAQWRPLLGGRVATAPRVRTAARPAPAR